VAAALVTIRIAHVATVDLTLRFLLLPQLRRLRDEGYVVHAISAPGPWVGDLESEGITHLPWPSATRSWAPRSDVRAFRELIHLFRSGRFDLVHLHTPKAGVLGRIAARVAGVPVVVNTVHGYYAMPDDPGRRRLPVVAIEAVASRFSDLELFQSEEDLAWARRAHIAPVRNSVLLGNGCDVDRFDPHKASRRNARRALGIEDEIPVVGTVGRLVEEKGCRELLEAMAGVRRSVPDAVLLVAGEPDDAGAGGVSAADLESAGTRFAGWRRDIEVPLAAMDVFALPSWREGVPRSAIEAASMGLPLVLTDIRGCREIVRDGVEGMLVPVRDPRALANALERLLADEPLRRKLGDDARARALERFDERRVCNTLIAGYQLSLARKGIRAPGGPRTDELRIRRASGFDARALARLHASSMPNAFLPSLGEPFLTQLYRSLTSQPGAVTIVAENGAGIVGFAAGTRSVSEAYRRFVAGHGIRAAVAVAPRLLRPSRLRRAWETGTYAPRTGDLPDAEVLSIAVDRDARGHGLGRRLSRELLSRLAAIGVDEVKVVVDAANHPANALYESVGFRRTARLQVHRGTSSNVWVIGCRSFSRSDSPSS
jgi:glycosyltransferase involved in cell wall biosynthesis/ribosomal protein S18 acetylase RimI-like enzyme